MAERVYKKIQLSKIKPYERNNKKHDKNVDRIADSIKRNEYIAPIIVDEKNIILAGHWRKLALDKLGIKEIEVLQVTWLTDKQKADFRIADNRTTELSEWDYDAVLKEIEEFWLEELKIDFPDLDFDAVDLNEEAEDEVPDMDNVEIIVQKGDIFQLWDHRLMCWDATRIEDINKLMDGNKADEVVTDPPYNTWMQWKPKDEKARLSHMFNDSIENRPQFLDDVFTNYNLVTKWDCAFYVFIDRRRVNDIKAVMESIMDVKNVIVWDKKVHWLWSDYKFTYELCVVWKKGKPEIQNRYWLDYQDIRRLQREMWRNKDHATAKPVELIEKPITHASKQDDIVLDLFMWSGTTAIAAEKLNRKCYWLELDPKYIQVILKRYHDYTKWQREIKCINRDLDLTPILNG